ncbi:coiled-coil domain-containing protein 97 isoform X2 [Myripristis murdjan]|uniref:coiled-coil domain-containing protein 97 isoform X2 n=1 Tax=Myripristis murdjan TaxID=586833 RepID=UPI00117620B9|nr:coiled-coil domain-containing protein 97 isoform X2 [Myripristis murdjan]
MWGEIEPPDKPQQTSYESRDEKKAAVCHREPQEALPGREASREPRQDRQEVTSCVSAMVEAVARSGIQVKSQQIGEAELTLDQRREELLQQYRSRPLVFLERYQAYLKPQHLAAFSHLSSDPRAQHYSRVIQRRSAGHTNRTRVRNQRYAALRALQREGHYFSEEQMRKREPLLYEQYIGQYLTDEEVLERSQEAMQGGADRGAEGPGCGTGGLAHILLHSYEERLIQNRLQEEQEREEGAQEEDEDGEDDDDGVKEGEWEPTPEEKALLREEFISQMHHRFLDGKDKDFNYSEVDENPDYDNLDIVSRDAEEKYFDDEEEEYEEEEEEEELENKEEEEEEKMTE